jgi:hypothetical protein
MRMGVTNVEPLTIDGRGAVTIDTEKNVRIYEGCSEPFRVGVNRGRRLQQHPLRLSANVLLTVNSANC